MEVDVGVAGVRETGRCPLFVEDIFVGRRVYSPLPRTVPNIREQPVMFSARLGQSSGFIVDV